MLFLITYMIHKPSVHYLLPTFAEILKEANYKQTVWLIPWVIFGGVSIIILDLFSLLLDVLNLKLIETWKHSITVFTKLAWEHKYNNIHLILTDKYTGKNMVLDMIWMNTFYWVEVY